MGQDIKYGYWGVRGNGHVGRLLLAYCGEKFEDKRYGKPDQWFGKDKKQIGLPFANLPYLIDGDMKITQSSAIYLYIIKNSGKKELLGRDLKDEARVSCLISVYIDMRTEYFPLAFNPDWKKKLPDVITKITPKLDQMQKLYGDKEFALGYLTLADFYLSEFSHHAEIIMQDVYAKYPFLKRLRTAFENLPEIKKYYSEENSMKGPFFPQSAVIKA